MWWWNQTSCWLCSFFSTFSLLSFSSSSSPGDVVVTHKGSTKNLKRTRRNCLVDSSNWCWPTFHKTMRIKKHLFSPCFSPTSTFATISSTNCREIGRKTFFLWVTRNNFKRKIEFQIREFHAFILDMLEIWNLLQLKIIIEMTKWMNREWSTKRNEHKFPFQFLIA